MSEYPEQTPWGGTERRKSNEGFAVNSWSSLVSFMSVCLMAVGGISWGLKLESRIEKNAEQQLALNNQVKDDVAELRVLTARGILPVAEVRIQALDARVTKAEDEIKECKNRHSKEWGSR